MSVSLVVREDQRRELELQVVVRYSKPVLETELGPSSRAASAWRPSFQPNANTFYFNCCLLFKPCPLACLPFLFFSFFYVDILGFCCLFLFQDWVSRCRGLSFRLVLKLWQFSDLSLPVAGITSVSHYTQRRQPWRSEVSQCSVVVCGCSRMESISFFVLKSSALLGSPSKSIFLVCISLASSVLFSTSRAHQDPSLFYMQLSSSMSRVCSVKFHIGQLSQSRQQPPRANLKCRPLSTYPGPFSMVHRPLLCYS